MVPMMIFAISAALTAAPSATTNLAASSVSSGGAGQASAGSASQTRPAAPEKIYCTSGTITGSRVVKKECKTKAQWAKDGVSIDDLMNSEQE